MSYKLRPCPFCGLPAEGAMKVCTCEQDTYKMTREQWNTRLLEDALTAENERLRKALESLRIKEHDYFDADCWYACPKSGNCCDESRDKNQCTCGMDRQNEIIDNALRGEE